MECHQRPWMWLVSALRIKLRELSPHDSIDREHAVDALSIARSYSTALRTRYSGLPPMPRRKAGADPFFELQSILDWLLKFKDMPDTESIENFEAAEELGIGHESFSDLLDELSGLTPRYRLRRLRAKAEWEREEQAKVDAAKLTSGGASGISEATIKDLQLIATTPIETAQYTEPIGSSRRRQVAGKPPLPTGPTLTRVDQAICLLNTPGRTWTVAELARHVGCRKQTLHGSPKFKNAWRMSKSLAALRHGSKNDGQVEAIDEQGLTAADESGKSSLQETPRTTPRRPARARQDERSGRRAT